VSKTHGNGSKTWLRYFIVNFIGLSNKFEMLSLFSEKVRPQF